MPHGITQCYMPPDRGDIPAFTHNRSLYSNWIQGWVDLGTTIKARSPLTTYVLPFQPQSICSFVGIYSNPVEGRRLSLSSSRTEVNSSYKHAQTDENFYIGRAGVCKLYGDTHHRERFWKRKLVCCQLKNRQTLYRSIGMINKIIWRKYYTECWSATIIILSSNVMWIYRARYHIKSRTRCCNTQKLHNSATTALLPDSA